MFTIVRQKDFSPIETRVATKYALLNDNPVITTTVRELDLYVDGLWSGDYLPIGSVEFVRQAMRLAGIQEPPNITYPSVLRPFLKRNVEQRIAGSVFHAFVKPIETKLFTGFVFDAMQDPQTLDEFTAEQHEAFMSLPADHLVWVSEVMKWSAECRYYVREGKLLGYGRYDDGPDDWPEPPIDFVQQVIDVYESQNLNTPIAYSLDIGMLDWGEPALVEVNDAWALGFYKGTLSDKDYIEMLYDRWQQLISTR